MRRVPPRFAIDGNDSCDISAALGAGVAAMGRYLSDDGFPRDITAEEVERARGRHFDFWLIWQNAHAEELWAGRSGAEIVRKADAKATQHGFPAAPLFISVDKWTSLRGEWPISPVLERFEEAAEAVGVERLGAYGTRYTMAQLFGRGLITYGMQTDLFHLAGGETPPPRHPQVQIVQFANADIDRTLPRFGVPFGDGHYCGHNRILAHDFGQVRPS